MGIAEIVPAHTFNFSRDDAVYWRKDTDDECPRISQIIVPTNRHWGIGEPFLTALSSSDIICSWLSPPNYEGGERLSFQEIILLLTFIGSCIYATVSLTLKVLEFLLKNKKSRWLGLKSAAKRKHSHKAAIIMKIALRFRKAIFGAPSGTRTQDPLIKSQLLYQLS